MVLRGDLRRVFCVAVEDRSEFRRVGFGVESRVIFPDVTNANDANAERFHARVKFEKAADMREVASEPHR